MSKIKLLLFFCTLIYTDVATSQSFNSRSRFDTPASFNLGMCVVGDYIYTTGMCANNASGTSTATYFTKYSLSGELLKFEIISLPNRTRTDVSYNTLHYDSVSNILYTTGYTVDDNSDMRIFVLELDTQLNLLRNFEYYFLNRTIFGRNLIRKKGGGYYLIGDIQKMDYNLNIILLSIDSLGSVKWQKMYGMSGSSNREVSTNIMLKDDSTLLSNTSRHTGELPNWVFSNIMIEWDTAGNFKSEKVNLTPQIGGAWGIGKSVTGGYYFCAGKITMQDLGGAGGLGHIQRLDSAYNTIWSLSVGYPYFITMLRDIKETQDGSLISVGFYFFNGDIPSHQKHHYGWIVKASADGDSVWQRFYLGAIRKGAQLENNEFYDVELLQDGSIVACGMAADINDTFPQQAWLLRINAEGCMDDGSCGEDPIPVYIEPVIEQLTIFKVFPNPAKDYCNLSLSSDCLGGILQLTDFNGCELEEWKVTQTSFSINLHKHPPGTYLLHIIRDDGLKISKKLVVE